MKISELREKSATELERMLIQQRDKIRDARFKIAARQLTNVRDIREARKLIAQILTLQRSHKKA